MSVNHFSTLTLATFDAILDTVNSKHTPNVQHNFVIYLKGKYVRCKFRILWLRY